MSKHRWDSYGIKEARLSASMSKDPSKQVGACIMRPDGSIASKGWNGFPRGCDDDPNLYADKTTKLMRTVHAEANAIVSAAQSLKGCTIYVSPLQPCSNCAGLIIQSGIKRVVTDQLNHSAKWQAQFDEAKKMFEEANIMLDFIDPQSIS